MVTFRRFTPLLAVCVLLFLTSCQDSSGPDGPVGVDLAPAMSHVTNDHPDLGDEDNGLFFFRPPIDEDEAPQGFLDTAVKSILFLELCNVEGLDNSFDPFTSVCPAERLVARLDDNNPVFGQTLTIESAGSFDFYQAVLKLNELGPVSGELHAIRVMIGSPETAGAFFVPGHVGAIFTDNASQQDTDANPPIFRVGDLPVKFYLSDLATRQLFCGDVDVDCTFEVWQLDSERPEDICHPVNDCEGSEALAGLRMDQGALQEVAQIIGKDEILVVCSGIDLAENPNPLGVGLPQIPVFVDCGFTPSFGTLTENVFDVQLCFASGVADEEGFVGAHLKGSEVTFLGERFGSVIFGEDNCGDPGQLAGDPGLIDKIRFAALNGVLRPLARVLGPQPLWARDATTWSSTSASPFGPVLRLDVLPNQGPDPIEEAGATVPVSVCVAINHDERVAPESQVDIDFKVTEGGGSIVGSTTGGSTKTVTTALREKTTDDECTVSDGGTPLMIAEASVDWTLSAGAELNELTASIPGEYAEIVFNQDGAPTSEAVDVSHTFSTQTIELLAACTTPDAFAAYDEFGHRGFYIRPPEFEIVGAGLHMVKLRISSNNDAGKGLAGTYRVSLSARDGSYDPNFTIETVETTFTLSGNAPENETVSFVFEELTGLSSTPVAFIAEILDAPKHNARLWFRVPNFESIDGFPQKGDPDCTGAIVTNGTTFTTPLDTSRRQGVDIRLLGG